MAPVSNYGKSKLAGEAAARKFAGQLPITIIRPPIVFGFGDDSLLGFVENGRSPRHAPGSRPRGGPVLAHSCQ